MNYKGKFVLKKEPIYEDIPLKSGRTLTKMTLVCDKVTNLNSYESKIIAFVAVGKEASELSSYDFRIGVEMEVEFDVSVREWNGRFFTDLRIQGLQLLGDFRGEQRTDGNFEEQQKEEVSFKTDDGNAKTVDDSMKGNADPFANEDLGEDDLPF